MTATQATTTTGTVFVGKCLACKTAYSYIETARGAHNGYRPNSPYCPCRADIACTERNCISSEPHTHPVTAIKFTAVNSTVTDGPCAAACTGAFSNKCACSCGGHNHGMDNRLTARNQH